MLPTDVERLDFEGQRAGVGAVKQDKVAFALRVAPNDDAKPPVELWLGLQGSG